MSSRGSHHRSLPCVACIFEPSRGRLTLDGDVVYDDRWLKADLRRLRLDKIGFIFQYSNLLPFLEGGNYARRRSSNANEFSPVWPDHVADSGNSNCLAVLVHFREGRLLKMAEPCYLIPLVNIIALYFLAFSKWPNLPK
ncbi:MAG TPA: hypothetical protein PKE02_11450 [Methyloceanibacter sp.]|nr:hypothetical protein [Methyloceanibacter sp.]